MFVKGNYIQPKKDDIAELHEILKLYAKAIIFRKERGSDIFAEIERQNFNISIHRVKTEIGNDSNSAT
jgi:hypothetical protein